jgi:hypothetical protein
MFKGKKSDAQPPGKTQESLRVRLIAWGKRHLNRNTNGKTTHTPQLKALRLDNPSLQKASRHE